MLSSSSRKLLRILLTFYQLRFQQAFFLYRQLGECDAPMYLPVVQIRTLASSNAEGTFLGNNCKREKSPKPKEDLYRRGDQRRRHPFAAIRLCSSAGLAAPGA